MRREVGQISSLVVLNMKSRDCWDGWPSSGSRPRSELSEVDVNWEETRATSSGILGCAWTPGGISCSTYEQGGAQ